MPIPASTSALSAALITIAALPLLHSVGQNRKHRAGCEQRERSSRLPSTDCRRARSDRCRAPRAPAYRARAAGSCMICAAARCASAFDDALRLQDQRELVLLRFGRLLDLLALLVQLHRRQLASIRDGEPLAERHRARAGDQTGNARQQDRARRRARARDAHHQTEVRHQPVVGAEHCGAQVVARGVAMPRLGATDLARRACSSDASVRRSPRRPLRDRAPRRRSTVRRAG